MSPIIDFSPENQNTSDTPHVDGLYKDWFLDYASYVILERAIPALYDGFKPVQRRILHAMKEQDDGRFTKVANIIGQTMQYHPHGDQAIGDALVKLGQKDLLIETQGNWGDVRTGDDAAAPRYIEARLSKFALHTIFNEDNTAWQMSYDGRKREPIIFPVKFPLLLAQGTDGIAVGLSTKIMPHNFVELCQASIEILKGNKTKILPDFPTYSMIDASNYNSGKQGGKIRCRSHIEVVDKKTLVIKDVPYGVTTETLVDSILKANDKGKIKIKKVTDNTAKEVELTVELLPGTPPEMTIDALYAFTDCEISISPNACVIVDNKPLFLSVDELLEISTAHTKDLLKKELEIKRDDLELKWHFSSLEKIFIENRIYRDIEECETWEAVIATIDKGLTPHKPKLQREVTQEDIVRLTEIRIKRISKFDAKKADEAINELEKQIKQINKNLKNLTAFVIDYFNDLIQKFGKDKERRTDIKNFDTIEVRAVVANNQKLYLNRADGFIGYGLKKDEYICDCSDIDDIIIFRRDGVMMVTKIGDKKFVGKDIIYANVWRKDDERTIYNIIFSDNKTKRNFAKRFPVTSITRDKEYVIAKGEKTKILHFTANPNGEAEVVSVKLTQASAARIKQFEYNFADLLIKGRDAQGNVITPYPIQKIDIKQKGISTLGGTKIWYDFYIGRLSKDKAGNYLGEFMSGEHILVVLKSGIFYLTNFELSNKYDPDKILHIQKLDPDTVFNVVYFDGETKHYYVKRFVVENHQEGKEFDFITENPNSKLIFCSLHPMAKARFWVLKGKSKEKVEVLLDFNQFMEIKGWKAQGNRLTQFIFTGEIEDLTDYSKSPEHEEELHEQNEYMFDIGTSIDLSPEVDIIGEQGKLFE